MTVGRFAVFRQNPLKLIRLDRQNDRIGRTGSGRAGVALIPRFSTADRARSSRSTT